MLQQHGRHEGDSGYSVFRAGHAAELPVRHLNHEAEDPLEFLDDLTVHAVCAVCGKPVRDGERVVSIARNLEQIERDGTAHNVLDSVLLASLCESCGAKYPEERIRVVFE